MSLQSVMFAGFQELFCDEILQVWLFLLQPQPVLFTCTQTVISSTSGLLLLSEEKSFFVKLWQWREDAAELRKKERRRKVSVTDLQPCELQIRIVVFWIFLHGRLLNFGWQSCTLIRETSRFGVSAFRIKLHCSCAEASSAWYRVVYICRQHKDTSAYVLSVSVCFFLLWSRPFRSSEGKSKCCSTQ